MALEPYRNEVAFTDKSRAIDLDVGRVADIGDSFRGLGRKAMQLAEPGLKKKVEDQADAEAFKTLDAKDADGKPIRVKAATGGSYFRDRHNAITGQVHMDLRMVEIEQQLDVFRKEAGMDVAAFGASAQGYMAGILKTVDPDLAPEMTKRISQEVRQRALGLASEVRTKGTQAEAQMLSSGIKIYQKQISDLRERDPADPQIQVYKQKIVNAANGLVKLREMHPEMLNLIEEADTFEVMATAQDAQDDLDLADEGGSIDQINDLAAGNKLYNELLTNPNHPIAKKIGKERLPRYMQRLGRHLGDMQEAANEAEREARRREADREKELEKRNKRLVQWQSGRVTDEADLDMEFAEKSGFLDPTTGTADPAATTRFMRSGEGMATLEMYLTRFKGTYLPAAAKNWIRHEMTSGEGQRPLQAVELFNNLTTYVGPNGETYGMVLKQKLPVLARAAEQVAMMRARGDTLSSINERVKAVFDNDAAIPVRAGAGLEIFRKEDKKNGAKKYQQALQTSLARAYQISDDEALKALNDPRLLRAFAREVDAAVSHEGANEDNIEQVIGNIARGLKGMYSYSPHVYGGVSASNWGHNKFPPDILDRAWEHSFKNRRLKLTNPSQFRGSFTNGSFLLQPPHDRPMSSARYGRWKVWRKMAPGQKPVRIGEIDMDFFSGDAARRQQARNAGGPSQIKAAIRGK